MKKRNIFEFLGWQWHLAAIFLYIFFEVRMLYQYQQPVNWIKVGVFYLYYISFFYFSALWLIPFIKQKVSVLLARITLYMVWVVTASTLLALLGLLLQLATSGRILYGISQQIYLFVFYRCAYFFVLAKAYSFFRLSLTGEKEKRRQLQIWAEAKQREAALENAFLRNQINTHFLFNTLSCIYRDAIKEGSPLAAPVLTLAEMMHYSLKADTGTGTVALEEDLDYLEQFIRMQQLIAPEQSQVHFHRNLPDVLGSTQIPPLLFYGFVENVFHHGDLSSGQNPAEITVARSGRYLHFYCRNRVRPHPVPGGHRIGLENTRARLDKFFPDSYSLVTALQGYEYYVDLKINLWNH